MATRFVGTEGIEMAFVPVPESETDVETVPLMFNVPLERTLETGVNRTRTVQLAAAASTVPLAHCPPRPELALVKTLGVIVK